MFYGTTLKQKIPWLLVIYVANVLVFALVYWLMWLSHPDYFIVHEELNILPIQQLRSLVASDTPANLQEYPIAELGILYGVSVEKRGCDRCRVDAGALADAARALKEVRIEVTYTARPPSRLERVFFG